MDSPTSFSRRHTIVGALVIAIVCVAFAVWMRSAPGDVAIDNVAAANATSVARAENPSSSLPPQDTPLKNVFDALKARADSGDAAAASRLYRDTQRCLNVAYINRTVADVVKRMLTQNTASMSAQQLSLRENMLGQMQHQLDQARQNVSFCEGLADKHFDQLLPMTFRAAQLGDNEAAHCYVGGVFLQQDGVLDHPEWLAQYRQNAMAVADRAVERGDWTMVAQLRAAYAGTSDVDNFSQITGYDPAMQYRYLKLERLGADAKDADDFQNAIVALLPSLNENDVAAGDAWADETHRRYFAAQTHAHAVTSIDACRTFDD
ncbi:MAG: hypothetical protein ABJB01_01310 [Rudaea sp.]